MHASINEEKKKKKNIKNVRLGAQILKLKACINFDLLSGKHNRFITTLVLKIVNVNIFCEGDEKSKWMYHQNIITSSVWIMHNAELATLIFM